MSEFKIVFPTGYQVLNTLNDNIDLNIVMKDGRVFFSTFFTPLDIQKRMTLDGTSYFWATDMVVVRDLHLETIRNSVAEIIQGGYLEYAFAEIGSIKSVCPGKHSYEEIQDEAI